MRTTKLHYTLYNRISGPPSEVAFLLVPPFFADYPFNPFLYQKAYEELEICDFLDPELVTNTQKTIEERALVVVRSPRIMALNSGSGFEIYVRRAIAEALMYDRYECQVVQPFTKYDFVAREDVAKRYLSRIGVFYDDFEAARKKELIGTYQTKQTSHYQKTDNPKGRKNMQLFLLSELNALPKSKKG